VCCPPNVSLKTHRTYRDLCEDHIIPALGHIELSELGHQQVQQFLNNLLNKPKPRKTQTAENIGLTTIEPQEFFSPKTVKHCRDVLRAALNVAMKWNLVVRNAAALAMIPTIRRSKRQIFDREQARAFLEDIHGDQVEALFWLALCIGPRKGELLGLQWTDFDFENGRVYLRRWLQRVRRAGEKKSHLELLPTKTEDSERGIWLPQIVVEKVLAHRTGQEAERKLGGSVWCENEMVFTTSIVTMLDARNMLRSYYRLRDRMRLPKIRFHDLRHSVATILRMAGVPDQVIQKLLGHASVLTTQEIYTHLTLDAEKRPAEKMDEIFRPVAVTVAVKNAKVRPS
jgi:integrase